MGWPGDPSLNIVAGDTKVHWSFAIGQMKGMIAQIHFTGSVPDGGTAIVMAQRGG